MTESQWLASEDPAEMLRCVTMGLYGMPPGSGYKPPLVADRKLRLFGIALADAYHRGSYDLTNAYLWVDGKAEAPLPDGVRWELYDVPASAFANDTVANFTARGVRSVWLLAPVEELTKADAAALLREIVGNPFRPIAISGRVECRTCAGTGELATSHKFDCYDCDGTGSVYAPCPWLTWRGGTVPRLARSIYDRRAWEELGVLADALEEAGCDDAEILRHLRGYGPCPCRYGGRCAVSHCDFGPESDHGWRKLRGPHVRGCWVTDLLLGLE